MQAPQTPEQYRAKAPRTYWNQHNYARFIFDMRIDPKHPAEAKPVEFANHRYITDDIREIAQLDAVADRPGTMIYTKPDSQAALDLAEELAREQQADIRRTANARDDVNNVKTNRDAPIVPAMVGGGTGTAIVGMKHSFSDVVGQQGNPAAAEALRNLQNMQEKQNPAA